MTADEEREAKRLARESGWPDEMYFGLAELVYRSMPLDFERRYPVERNRQ